MYKKFINWLNRYWYKKYCNEKIGIVFIIDPDHIGDCYDEGEVRSIRFNSGNRYKAKMIKKELDRSRLAICTYLMSNNIQKLSFEEFCIIYKYKLVKLGYGKYK